ncbi:unnamed protein product [Ranitomeya imitator]|uniref:Core-binding (CB) domain-containing protein n=1 Tax=Ranitomeya imitator TaxID=111125 RepID=A0ABN9M5Q7_9NEOB|nr:unnamed protein product [Ranitomeya imitator]
MLSARKASSASIYHRVWKSFFSWCRLRGHPPLAFSIPCILNFLQSGLDSGLALSSLKGQISALSVLFQRRIAANLQVKTFIQGVSHVVPTYRMPLETWDLNLVLGVLQEPPFEPLQDVPLSVLSWKVAFLVAVTSIRRVSELAALSCRAPFLAFHQDKVVLRPSPAFLPKVVSSFHLNEDIILPSFCPQPKHRVEKALHTLDVCQPPSDSSITHGPVSPNEWLGEKDFTVCDLLTFLVIESQDDENLYHTIRLLDPFPDHPLFKNLRQTHQKIKYSKGAFSLIEEVNHFLSVSVCDSLPLTRLEGLNDLRKKLQQHKDEMKDIVRDFQGNPQNNVIPKLVMSLLELSKKAVDLDNGRDVLEAVGSCLGELGPIDFCTIALQHRKELLYGRAGGLFEDKELQCVLIILTLINNILTDQWFLGDYFSTKSAKRKNIEEIQ